MNEVASATNKTIFQWTKDPELTAAAAEIRGYYNTAKLSYLQIGKKLLEIKDRFEHGEWENFLETNTRMSVRGAQQCMQAYKAYGFDTRYIEIGQSKGIVMLPMPENERERLMNENDVSGMSVAELKKKIREIRDEEREKAREAVEAERTNGQIQLAKAAERAEEEKRRAVAEATKREPEIVQVPTADPALVDELEKSKAEIDRLVEANKTMMDSLRDWSREKAEMQAEIEENNDIIRQQQDALNDAQNELLNLKSARNRGDDRLSDGEEMTLDTLQRAVREFMGWVSMTPQMHATFSTMPEKELRRWREAADTVAAWARDTLLALDTVNAEGGYTIE